MPNHATTETQARQMVLDAIAYLTASWGESGCLYTDFESINAALGDMDFQSVCSGLSGIVTYLAGAVARFEGQRDGEMREARDVIADIAAQVAADL